MATYLNRCCVNACKLGGVIPKFDNITKVRPVGDPLGPHYTVTPYPRFSFLSNEFACVDEHGVPAPAGTCGNWLFGGDLNGVSAQEINDAVDDILACGGPPFVTSDHNCYQQNGTVDMTVNKLFGWQGVLARKNWHGTFGLISNDGCPTPDPNIPPDQTKYRTINFQYAFNVTGYDESGSGDHHPDNKNFVQDGSGNGFVTVNAVSGAITGACNSSEKTQSFSEGVLFDTSNVVNGAGLWTDGKTYPYGLSTHGDQIYGANYCCRGLPPIPAGGDNSFGTFDDFVNSFNAFAGANWPAISSSPDNYNQSGTYSVPGYPGTHSLSVTVQISRTNDSLSWNVSWDELIEVEPESPDLFENTRQTVTFSGLITLTDPYTADQCFQDWRFALNTWDLSDLSLSNLRSDSLLANLPLIIHDELPPTSPMGVLIPHSMNDLLVGLVNDINGVAPGGSGYITTWAQRSWVDSRNSFWRYADNTTDNPHGLTSGANLVTPLFDGRIVSHNLPGSARHFWFGYGRKERDLVPDSSDPDILHYEWFDNATGDYSDPNLPACSMRWLDNDAAQYDGAAFRNSLPAHPGNYPQGWWRQQAGTILGGKYIQATQPWPSVNYGRPCGADKFSADQLTICAVVSSDPGHLYSVKITANANAPGAIGGIAIGDFIIIENDGIYSVTGITHDGNTTDGTNNWDQYTITVGAKIDDLPNGYNIGRVTSNDETDDSDGATYLGKLRFSGYAGICGRVAISCIQAGGTVTITPNVPQPYLRKDPASGTIAVDLYDATVTLIVGNVNLTRVDDSTFTFPSGIITAPVWMTAHGFDWTQYDSSSKRTGVHLEWTFNQRLGQPGYIGVPSFYGGITGCTGISVQQFNYVNGNCAAVVGIVPEGSPEKFENTNFFGFPAPVFDDAFGAFYQAAVMLTMPDPLWQPNFKPDGEVFFPTTLVWQQDNGTGEQDQTVILESGHDQLQHFFPHHPLVEASCTQAAPLPAGISLPLDPTKNIIAPPYYPFGIPIGDNTGGYATLDTDWGFKQDACAPGNRFASNYLQFVQC